VQAYHIPLNLARVLLKFVTAPVLALAPYAATQAVINLSADWQKEYADTPPAVLASTAGIERTDSQYCMTGFQPKLVLKVDITGGQLSAHNQVQFSDAIKAPGYTGYTALSYPVKGVAEAEGFVASGAEEGRTFTLAERRSLAEKLLRLYCSAERRGGNPDRTEYIWLDEFCLSNDSEDGDKGEKEIEDIRAVELGRLADIFRNATSVAVFCNELNCDHTDLKCSWGTRIWTIPEILHAKDIQRMTRQQAENTIVTRIFPTSGREFRERIQRKAAKADQWHL
jgi:hypothetical protein